MFVSMLLAAQKRFPPMTKPDVNLWRTNLYCSRVGPGLFQVYRFNETMITAVVN